MRTPLGKILLQRGGINDIQLAHALKKQKRNGSRLGDILIADGATGYYALYQSLAVHYGMPFIDLLKETPDPALLDASDADTYLRLNAMPWRMRDGRLCIALCDPSPQVLAWIEQRYGQHSALVLTSPHDIRRTVERLYGAEMETASRLSLWQRLPDISARHTLQPRHKGICYGAIMLASVAAFAAPFYSLLTLIFICHLAYASTMVFKCMMFTSGAAVNRQRNWTKRLASLEEKHLPVYTLLIPMYREAATLPQLFKAMQNLDYPPSKLDIKILLEDDDHETIAAAYAAKPPYHFDIIRVPSGIPRTKPKACNYALRFARGEFITVFDADDRPERSQLKKAVYMFRTLPPDVVCLQARLNYYNANDNWLTRFFSLEYAILFKFMLHGLEHIGIPIPLGGTSNHMALARLKELGEWDPFNVTEDADLGARLAAHGFRTAMLDSYTMEEAPNKIAPWVRQRSRWIKGYMQTWLVHMRKPVTLYNTLGRQSFFGFQFFVGLSSFTFLTAPLVWGSSFLCAGHTGFPQWLCWFTLLNLATHFISQWYCALSCARLYPGHKTLYAATAFFYPLYFILHSIASYRALWQLFTRPHFWEKTQHGLAAHHDMTAGEGDAAEPQEVVYTGSVIEILTGKKLRTA